MLLLVFLDIMHEVRESMALKSDGYRFFEKIHIFLKSAKKCFFFMGWGGQGELQK